MRLALAVAIVTIGGCVGVGGGQRTTGARPSPPPAAEQPALAPSQSDVGTRLVIPATGGPPVMATPEGSGLYLPVTGGPPVAGTPLFP